MFRELLLLSMVYELTIDICVHCGNLREEPNYIHLKETLDNVS